MSYALDLLESAYKQVRRNSIHTCRSILAVGSGRVGGMNQGLLVSSTLSSSQAYRISVTEHIYRQIRDQLEGLRSCDMMKRLSVLKVNNS